MPRCRLATRWEPPGCQCRAVSGQDEARFITGVTLMVDGGAHCRIGWIQGQFLIESESYMPRYNNMMARMAAGECILIDGATGTEAERRGVPQLDNAWNGGGALSHPDIVRQVHLGIIIQAGAEVIISNSFATIILLRCRRQARMNVLKTTTACRRTRRRSSGARRI